MHIKNIFKKAELEENAVVKYYLITASDSKRYKTKYENRFAASPNYRTPNH